MSPRDTTRPAATRRVRLADVARLAGVSEATASYVLSGTRGRRPASDQTQVRVREAAVELGYVPNGHAQAIRRGYSSSIVLALGFPEDPWTAQVAMSVQQRAIRHNFSTLMLVDETWHDFLHGFTPGVAFITGAEAVPGGIEKATELARAGLRLVVFSTDVEATHFDVITSSAVEAAEDAYARLRRRHDRVHVLSTTNLGADPLPGRMGGLAAAARAAGDDLTPRVVSAGLDRAQVPRACAQLLDTDPTPTAVVCSTGYLATALRSAALVRGIDVPGELEIIAIGDIPRNHLSSLGPVSYYGTPDVFERIARIVVDRAVAQDSTPYVRHDFVWQYFPGSTTRPGDGQEAS